MFLNSHEQYHEMRLETVHSSGAEEWYCPICGRRFLMQMPPAYNKLILEQGDESAIHSGERRGLGKNHPELMPREESSTTLEESTLARDEEAYLRPWLDWMNRVNFESLWNRRGS